MNITRASLGLAFLSLLTLSASSVFYIQPGVGARSRDVQSHIRELGRNVRDFGATGDGTTNDTTAFSNAIAAAGVGGMILIPTGHYRVDGMTLLNRQHVLGLGGGGGGSVGVVLSKFSGAPAGIACPSGAQRLNVTNLELKDYAIAIDLRGVNYSYFADIALTNNGRDIYLGGSGSIGNTLQHMRSTGSTIRPIDSDRTTSPNNINNNRFIALTLESGAQSILAGIGGNGAAGNSFLGCEFQGNGILCNSVSGLEFGEGCYFEGGVPIDLDDACYGVSIRGSYFQNFFPAAIRVGYRNGTNIGSGSGLDLAGNAFYNEQPNGIGIYVLSPNLGEIRIGANAHNGGGHSSYVPVHDLNNIAVEKTRVVVTGSLPAASQSNDGKVIIEDAGPGNRNLIIYAGGQRFRIDGGSSF